MSDRSLALTLLATCALCLSSCQKHGTDPPAGKELDSPYLLGATTGSQNYLHTFGGDGAYWYHCVLHTTAHYREGGVVFVNSSGGDSAFVRIFQGKFDPESVTVRAGAQVRWQNFDDGTSHSVTSD
jgi:plastocyanin